VVAVKDAVRQYLQYLTVERGLAANTIESYQRDLDRYAGRLAADGKSELNEVREADISGFLAALRTGDESHPPLAVSSAGRAVVAVRGLHAFAHFYGLVGDDAAREVSPPAPPRRLPKAISVHEVERLLTMVPGDGPRALRDRALLEFLYGTGARISEVIGLDVSDLELAADPVVLLDGKGGKQRVVPVGSYAVRTMEAYLVRARPALAEKAERASRGVFLNARGGRLTRQGAWGIIQTAAERASLGHVSPHTLRHSFATHLLDGGADIRVVQELLGHASVTTTQVYTLVTVDKLREVYAAAHPRAR
jgi:integrase/recombinase XerD